MQASQIPTKFQDYWAVNASGAYVRTVPVTTVDPNAASFALGFPPNTAAALAAGGVPPDMRDFNGAYQAVTQWLQWMQAGNWLPYDSTFQTAIGGYYKGAIVASVTTFGQYYLCTTDNNTTNPDAGGAGWMAFSPTAIPAGSVLFFAMQIAPSGWLECNGGATSRTTYANLFAAIGTIYGAGDGSTTFNLPDLRGEFLRGYDDGRGVDSGRTFGSTQAYANASHTHSINGSTGAIAYGSSTGLGSGATVGLGTPNYVNVTGSAGGSESRPTNVALYPCIKY